MPASPFRAILDSWSCILGLLAGILALGIFATMRGYWPALRQAISQRLSELSLSNTQGAERLFRRGVLLKAQRSHLAASLFPLDDIVLPPRLLAPPAQLEPGRQVPSPDIVAQTIADLPDWPEFPAYYSARSLDIFQTLQTGINLLLIGHPGSGKTTALAYLASALSRQDPVSGLLTNLLPIYLHVSALMEQGENPGNPVRQIVKAAATGMPGYLLMETARISEAAVMQGKAILLLDGLDELPPTRLKETTLFLEQLIKAAPKLRLVTTANPDYWDGLARLGLHPMALAGWGPDEAKAFLRGWASAWMPSLGLPEKTDLEQITAWVLARTTNASPLEWTLQAWNAYTNPQPGGLLQQALETYLGSLLSSAEQRSILEQAAGQMISHGGLSFTPPPKQSGNDKDGPIVIEAAVQSGLLDRQSGKGVAFSHPLVAGYLASAYFASHLDAQKELFAQPAWIGQTLSLRFLTPRIDLSAWIDGLLANDAPPLYRNTFRVARWQDAVSSKSSWKSSLLNRLINLAQNETEPVGIRQRALIALTFSRDPRVLELFHGWISSASPVLRQLGALGTGFSADNRSISSLCALLNDLDYTVRRAACLSLVAFDTLAALEPVASALLTGDEDTRRIAAEALANNRGEGYAALKEASSLADPQVRRAAVYGLSRISSDWAIAILEKLRREDGHFRVRTAAIEALEWNNRPHPGLPRDLPPASQSPWLISFAARAGSGIPAGSSGTDKLLQALRNGSEEEQAAALEYLALSPDPETVAAVIAALSSDLPGTAERAARALWLVAGTGFPVYVEAAAQT